MTAFNKFNQFVEDLGKKKIDLSADSLKFFLTNTAPNAADTLVDTTTATVTLKATSNAAEIAAGNGYSKGGPALAGQAYAQSSGTGKLTANALTVTAAGGPVGPFRYAVLYDDTSGTTSTRTAIGWYDYGSAITLADGESFKIAKDTSGNNWDSTTPLLSVA